MDKSFHVNNRQRTAAHLADGDVMLFFSGESVRKSADESYPFFANRNFLYLTGVQQERSALLLQRHGELVQERLFVLQPDPAQEIWSGRRLTAAELDDRSGIGQIEDIARLDRELDQLLASQPARTLWLCFDAHSGERAFDIERQYARQVRDRHPQAAIKNSYPLLRAQRTLKAPEEIDAIRRAMQITEAGIRQVMRAARPGVREYELEAAFNAELARHGQRRTAFPSIISSGERNFYLHYAALDGCVGEGDLILVDVGAAYDGYCTDISRMVPANGKFSRQQAEIYRIAYAANRAIIEQVRPGMDFRRPMQICKEVAFEGLKALGLLDDPADIGRYVWHGTTHHVGLDTHDAGEYDRPVAENMIFTVDAGIYVREWGIGLRIEDNVLVTAGGCENLSASIPAAIEEVEAFLAG